MFYSAKTGGFYDIAIHGANIPADTVEITAEEHAALLVGQSEGKRIIAGSGGKPTLADPPAPNQEQIIAQYEKALDNHLDSVAKLYRYDTRFTFALRAGFPGPYHDAAVAFATWMDTCNLQAFTLLSEVQAGNAVMPTIEAFIASLPEFSL